MNYKIEKISWYRIFVSNLKFLVNGIITILYAIGFPEDHPVYAEIDKMNAKLQALSTATESEIVRSKKGQLDEKRDKYIHYIIGTLRNNLDCLFEEKCSAAHLLWEVFDELNQSMANLSMIAESEQIKLLKQRWDNVDAQAALTTLGLTQAFEALIAAEDEFLAYLVESTENANNSPTNLQLRYELIDFTKEVLSLIRSNANLKDDALCIEALQRINVLIAEEDALLRQRLTVAKHSEQAAMETELETEE